MNSFIITNVVLPFINVMHGFGFPTVASLFNVPVGNEPFEMQNIVDMSLLHGLEFNEMRIAESITLLLRHLVNGHCFDPVDNTGCLHVCSFFIGHTTYLICIMEYLAASGYECVELFQSMVGGTVYYGRPVDNSFTLCWIKDVLSSL